MCQWNFTICHWQHIFGAILTTYSVPILNIFGVPPSWRWGCWLYCALSCWGGRQGRPRGFRWTRWRWPGWTGWGRQSAQLSSNDSNVPPAALLLSWTHFLPEPLGIWLWGYFWNPPSFPSLISFSWLEISFSQLCNLLTRFWTHARSKTFVRHFGEKIAPLFFSISLFYVRSYWGQSQFWKYVQETIIFSNF